MSAEPLLAIYVPLETRVVVHSFCDASEDEARLLLDLDQRDGLLDEIEDAVERFLDALRYGYGQGPA